MLKIHFFPESDLREEFADGARVYSELWASDGERIQNTMEEMTGLRFVETEINAVTFFGISHARPLRVRAEHPSRKAVLIHELLHRLIIGNKKGMKDEATTHRQLDLVLYDVWESLYGKNFADDSVQLEHTYHSPIYKESWDWALSFSKEERTSMFKESLVDQAILST